MQTLGQKIRNAREEHGFTQDGLGRAVGLTGKNPSQTIRKWEKGRQKPDPRYIRALARILRLDEDMIHRAKYPYGVGRSRDSGVDEPSAPYFNPAVAKIETLFAENKVPIEIQEECYERCLRAVESWLWRETMRRQKEKEGAGK